MRGASFFAGAGAGAAGVGAAGVGGAATLAFVFVVIGTPPSRASPS